MKSVAVLFLITVCKRNKLFVMFSLHNNPSVFLPSAKIHLPLHKGGQIIIISATPQKSIDNILTKV